MFSALLQPFVLIALGWMLGGSKKFPRALWDGVERLVYYVLFPPLLFMSVAHAEFSITQTGLFLAAGLLSMCLGVAMAWVVSALAPTDALTAASVRQTGYRFNSYICFALALTFYGPQGLAMVAVLTGFWVPVSSALAVADLAQAAHTNRQKSSLITLVRAIASNPLVVATLAGLLANAARSAFGWDVPKLAAEVMRSLGAASMATALLAIGAGIAVDQLKHYARLITCSTVQRLVALPAVALCMAHLFGLSELQTGALMCFAMVPTANSCYILAVQMGGNGPVVSDLTSVQVIASLASIPMWFLAIGAFG